MSWFNSQPHADSANSSRDALLHPRQSSHDPRQAPAQSAGAHPIHYTPSSRPAPQVPRGRFSVVECPSPALALKNALIVNPGDFPNVQYVMLKGTYPIGLFPDASIRPGTVGAARNIRQWAQLSLTGDVVDIAPLSAKQLGRDVYISSVDVEISFWFEKKATSDQYSSDDIADMFLRAFPNQLFSIDQTLVFEYRGINMKGVIRGLSNLTLDAAPSDAVPYHTMGILTPESTVNILKDPSSAIKLKSSAKRPPPNAILAPNFKFEDMGIGGLDTEFAAIFRRAFASRIFPPDLVEKLGIQHVKGLLLYGPPGTGKTLMARQIGKMLNAREPKVVNGPEILNKFVGQSEENIRKLFAEAEAEYKAKGDESGLHIIIFDELDAICKQRGSTNNGTGVGDSVVNQLLSKMDGVDQLNNILVIGMTNRLDMIDEALLRPGRLEVHIEISLPDEGGRSQILSIQTSKMRQNGVMGSDVDLGELASLTKNFSGAELGGLVKSATSFAFNRHVKVGTVAGVSDDIENLQVLRRDFLSALEEVTPAFGVSEEELAAVVSNGIIAYDESVGAILRDGKLLVDQVRNSARTPLVSVVLHGPPGSGKSALAATIAMRSEFPFAKLVSAEDTVGFSEAQKVQYLSKVFNDSYKSPASVIVIDSIERLLDWVPIGPRFSNAVLQALLVLLGKRPPKGRRLLVLCTTSNRAMLAEMQAMDAFATDLFVPPVTTLAQLARILREVGMFTSAAEEQRAFAALANAPELHIGIKRLLVLVETCKQDPEGAVDKLVSTLMTGGL